MKIEINNDNVIIKFYNNYEYSDIVNASNTLSVEYQKAYDNKSYINNCLHTYLLQEKIDKLLNFDNDPLLIIKWKSKINYHIHLNKCIQTIFDMFNTAWDKEISEYNEHILNIN